MSWNAAALWKEACGNLLEEATPHPFSFFYFSSSSDIYLGEEDVSSLPLLFCALAGLRPGRVRRLRPRTPSLLRSACRGNMKQFGAPRCR
eukprot:m.76916 g.76916  ORF g.76916 m.76916 type:complete len:90 (-) comp50469_c0_seq2:170-439(-)